MSYPPPYNHQESNIFCACNMCIGRREDDLKTINAINEDILAYEKAMGIIPDTPPAERRIEEIVALADAFRATPAEPEPMLYKSDPVLLEGLWKDIELYLEIKR